MIHSKLSTSLLALVVISLFITVTACDLEPLEISMASTLATPPTESRPFESHIECINKQCALIVSVGPLGEDEEVKVRLEADAGVLFADTHVVHEKIYGDYGRYKASESNIVSLHGQGKREFPFPFYVNSHETESMLPGEYIVRATLISVYNQIETDLYEDYITIFLVHDQDEIYPVATKQEFDTHYSGYYKGQLGLSYRLVLDDVAQPDRATLYVMVTSDEANYHPRIVVNTEGGVTIRHKRGDMLHTANEAWADYIDDGGCRILAFAVEINEGSLPINGDYIFNTVVEAMIDGQMMRAEEDAPVAIVIDSDIDNPHDHWLGVTTVPVSDVRPFTPLGIATVQSSQEGSGIIVEVPPVLTPVPIEPIPIPIPTEVLSGDVFTWENESMGVGGRGDCNAFRDFLALYDGNLDIAYQQLVVRDKLPITRFDFDRVLAQCQVQ